MKRISKIIVSGVIIGMVLTIVDFSIRFFSGGHIFFDESLLQMLLYYVIYSVPLSLVNSQFFDFLYRKEVWTKYAKYKLVIGFAGSVVLTLITIFFVRAFIEIVLEGESFNEFINGERTAYYFSALLITLVISLFFHAVYYYKEVQKNKVKEQKVIAGTASAKFDALKNQLDPHFLFNSLNVLTSLIEENPDNAQKFTTSLSKVYRYVLEQKNKELVTVDEELNFARTYMSLLKMRFEDSIIFDIPESASNPESKVVPLSLQLLLENAVKHNMVTTSKPLHIKIYEEGGFLVVMNNLQPKQIVKKSSGVGLSNIKQRYQLLTQKQVMINQGAKEFAVAIPMLTKPIAVMRRLTTGQQEIDDAYVRARKRVEELKGFYYSLISYIVVIPLLVYIWYTFSRFTIQWFWFPAIGWGLSLIIQAYRVFVDDGALGASWEKRKIEEYMRKEEQNRWN
ncbi:histidine kinase [Winogradskyella aurantiaca]|uniref:histidine kinase n=1 Tax=Winogradskyella aurantiaca TaxID=2219558 RepID=UPI000E1D597E|nr:histidine kinase [Winogradskyella aurantiaca]